MKKSALTISLPLQTLCLFFVIIFFGVSCRGTAQQKKETLTFEAMNTVMTITSYGKNAQKANVLAEKRIKELEDMYSTTKPKSDIFTLNSYALQNDGDLKNHAVTLHAETMALLTFALDMAQKTGGALNPALYPVTSAWGFTTGVNRVPSDEEIAALLTKTDFCDVKILSPGSVSIASGMQLDLGAAGKGFAGDEALKILRENGVNSAILDLGGNIQALGQKPDGSPWKIGVKNPWDVDSVAAVLQVSDASVITSGGYERNFYEGSKRYIHIFNGKTGRPVENECESVTVVCKSGLYADCLSTALFVMGVSAATEFWRTNLDFDFIVITKDNEIYYTQGLQEKLQVLVPFEKEIVVF